MEELLKRMSKEHEDMFPLATLDSQIKKLEEELSEIEKADSYYNTINELADCLIVSWGIYRFTPKVALLCASSIIGVAEQFGLKSVLIKSANAKWEFNKTRKWKYENGEYHHIGEDCYDC